MSTQDCACETDIYGLYSDQPLSPWLLSLQDIIPFLLY